jgi:hypothetical protein
VEWNAWVPFCKKAEKDEGGRFSACGNWRGKQLAEDDMHSIILSVNQ